MQLQAKFVLKKFKMVKNIIQSKSEASIFLVIWLLAVLAVVITTIYWGADRTLGLGDEGIYLLAARYPEEIQQHVSSVYVYTGYMFRLVGYDPVSFRLLGVFLVCISALILGFGYYIFANRSAYNLNKFQYFKTYSFSFILLGALLLYQWFYLTPNYNTLIAIAINISAGCVLWGLGVVSAGDMKSKTIFFAFSGGGLGIGLAIFTKFPAGFSIFAVYAFVFALWPKIKIGQRIGYFCALLFGLALWSLLHFVFIQPPLLWWEMLNDGWSLYQAYGAYSPYSKIESYTIEFFNFIGLSIALFLPVYTALLVIVVIFKINRLMGGVTKINQFILTVTCLFGGMLLSIKSGIYIDERHRNTGGIPFYLLFHLGWINLLFLLLVFLYYFKRNDSRENNHACAALIKKISPEILIIVSLLVFLPIAGSVGTANPIYNLPLCHAATWFICILILLEYLILEELKYVWLRMVCIVSVSAFTASQIVQGYIFNPQTNGRNLHYHVNPTEIGYPAVVLKLDSAEHILITDLSLAAKNHGFKLGDDIIAFDFIPGLVYAMGGKSPGHPTFLVGSKEREAYSGLALNFADIKRLKRSFVLLNVDADLAGNILASKGIDFPRNYELIATLQNSNKNYTLWKPVF